MKESIEIRFETFESIAELSDKDQQRLQKAKELLVNAYAPYSKFCVAAIVLLEDGTMVPGTNQENIAYPSGLCAERVALFSTGTLHPDAVIDTLYITVKGDLIDKNQVVSPCGGCRQVMVESESRQDTPFRVVLASEGGSVVIMNSARDLMPLNFGS